MWRMLALALVFAMPVQAENIVAGLSQNRVAIDASFDGSEILIFGAVKREDPIPAGDPLEVLIAVSGPKTPLTVRRKAKAAGIWINKDAVEIDAAPSFYALATSAPLATSLKDIEDLRHDITIRRVIRSVGAPFEVMDAASFSEAVIRIREKKSLYQLNEESIQFDEQTLFRTSIALPANLTEGDYTARMFLTRGGNVVSTLETSIDVRKVGLERWLYALAHDRPLIYGLMSLFIAIAAGWSASAAFRFLRN